MNKDEETERLMKCSYLNKWEGMNGKRRELIMNGFERIQMSFGVKMMNEGWGKGIYKPTDRNAALHKVFCRKEPFTCVAQATTHIILVL